MDDWMNFDASTVKITTEPVLSKTKKKTARLAVRQAEREAARTSANALSASSTVIVLAPEDMPASHHRVMSFESSPEPVKIQSKHVQPKKIREEMKRTLLTEESTHSNEIIKGTIERTHAGAPLIFEAPSYKPVEGYPHLGIAGEYEPGASTVHNVDQYCKNRHYAHVILAPEGFYYNCGKHTTFAKKDPGECTLCGVDAITDLQTPSMHLHGSTTTVLTCVAGHNIGYSADNPVSTCYQCRIEHIVPNAKIGTEVVSTIHDPVRVHCKHCGLDYYTSMCAVMSENAAGRFTKGLYECNAAHIPHPSQLTIHTKLAYYFEKMFSMQFRDVPVNITTGQIDFSVRYCAGSGLSYKVVTEVSDSEYAMYDKTNVKLVQVRIHKNIAESALRSQLAELIYTRALGKFANCDPRKGREFIESVLREPYKLH